MKRISLQQLIVVAGIATAFPLGVLLAEDKGARERERAERLGRELEERLAHDSEMLADLLRKAADGGALKLELDDEDARRFLEGDGEELAARLKELLRSAQQLDAEQLQQELRDNPDARMLDLEGDGDQRGRGDLRRFFQRQLGSRQPGSNEKDHRDALAEWAPVVARASAATASVLDDEGKQLALATVVHKGGYLVTKASELPGEVVTCEMADGTKLKAQRLDVFKSWDLALLKVDADDLTPIAFAGGEGVELGTFLAAAGTGKYPVATGVASVAPRNLSRANRGFLGIGMENLASGVRVNEVQRGTAARKAGIEVGDLILNVEGVDIRNSAQLATVIGNRKPGDKIAIRYRRGEDEMDVEAELGERRERVMDLDRFNRGNSMGGPLSGNRGDYPNALQHDLTLRPEECGGPLVNLDGEAVGVNIARGGRVKSYAIPAADLQALLAHVEIGRFAMHDKKQIEQELDAADKEVAEMQRRLEEAKKRREAAERALEDAE